MCASASDIAALHIAGKVCAVTDLYCSIEAWACLDVRLGLATKQIAIRAIVVGGGESWQTSSSRSRKHGVAITGVVHAQCFPESDQIFNCLLHF